MCVKSETWRKRETNEDGSKNKGGLTKGGKEMWALVQRKDGVRFCAYLTCAQRRQSFLSEGLGMGGKTWTQRWLGAGGKAQKVKGRDECVGKWCTEGTPEVWPCIQAQSIFSWRLFVRTCLKITVRHSLQQ